MFRFPAQAPTPNQEANKLPDIRFITRMRVIIHVSLWYSPPPPCSVLIFEIQLVMCLSTNGSEPKNYTIFI